MRTTMGYSLGRKEAVLKKMLPPNNQSIAGLAKEEGISDATLYNWRQQARNEGRLKAALETQPD
jgi:transposase-like protein